MRTFFDKYFFEIDSFLRKALRRKHETSDKSSKKVATQRPNACSARSLRNDFDLSREWYDWVCQDPFQGLPHQDPRNHIEELEDLVLRRSLTSWDDIERAFLYKFLDDAEATREKEKNDKWDRFLASLDEEYMIPIQLLDDIIAKRDEQHGFGEPSRAAEAETTDLTSTSIDTTPGTSIDTNTSMLIDSSTSESIDIGTSETIDTSTATPIDRTTSTSTNVTTSTSIDGTTSESIAHTIPSLIDRDSCFRTRPLEIPESSSCPQDITDSAQKSIDISSCDPTSDGDREITMEDLLELEEFLELEDGEKLEDLDSSRAVTMEDFLELEEWLEDMDQNSKKNLDDDQRTSRGYLETSPKVSINRHQPDGIDRQPPHIIDQCPPYIIDRQSSDSINLHPDSIIDRRPPDCIDRHPLLDESHGFIVEMEPIEERMHESEASHNADSKHLRPLICAEEAVGLHKRVKRIHDPVKIVVPCDVVGLASSSSSQPIQDEVDKGPAKAASIDTDRIPSKDTNKPASIDTITSTSIDTGRVSEQKKFDVCGNLRGGETTTRSDKVRSRCFSQPFAKLRALLIVEMIDKGEESMEETFTQE
ncbi:hypothetical protein DY000_02052278 [Brassica cretica]|uniref:Uncharacterized protein n=1 Tax=Brassica cretica TaxID=69181 RepID=A0ABQ7AL12_BRACR|nr:hypothetical protein DY000_02052278 [Brassica cretica]